MAFWEDWSRNGCCDCDCSWTKLAIWAAAIAVVLGGLLAVLLVAFAVVYPPTATAADALLTRLDLTTSSSMSFNATVTLSLRNPNIYRGISFGATPVTLSFFNAGSRLDDDSATVRAFELGARKTTTVRVTVGGVDRQVSPAGAAEFRREKDAGGRFAVEVRLDTTVQYKGRQAACRLAVVCPLRLQLVDPEVAATAFQRTKCTVVRDTKSAC